LKTLVLEKMPDKFWILVKERKLNNEIIPYSDSVDKLKIDALIIRTRTICDKNFINQYPNVKLVIRAGTGYDNIDIRYLHKLGVLVCNTLNANAHSAFEHTLALILSAMKQMNSSRNNILNGKWKKDLPYNLEFEDLKVLIVGVGRIGTKLADALKYFNASIKGVDPYLTESQKSAKGISFINYEDGLKWANLITYHCPLTKETFHYFNMNSLQLISEPIILINVSRGSVVDENAINFGLANNKFIAVGLDVYEHEPVSKNHFKDYKNVLFTPHTGAFTSKAKERMSFETLDVLSNFINGRKLYSEIL